MDWKIQARAEGCQACGKKFVDKQPYYTLLFDRRHCLERLDVCPGCWETQYSQGANDRKGFISFWQGLFADPAPPPPEPIQKESAESLLRKLMELGDSQYTAACFILAVMLERKRVFKVKVQSVQEGQRTIIYEHAKTGEVFNIADPDLQLRQLEETQHAVAHLLQHGVEAAATSTETPPPPDSQPSPDSAETAVVDASATAPAPEVAESSPGDLPTS